MIKMGGIGNNGKGEEEERHKMMMMMMMGRKRKNVKEGERGTEGRMDGVKKERKRKRGGGEERY